MTPAAPRLSRLLAVSAAAAAAAAWPAPEVGRVSRWSFEPPGGGSFEFEAFVPAAWSAEVLHPVLLYLHGGEGTRRLGGFDRMRTNGGLPAELAEDAEFAAGFPFITLFPQWADISDGWAAAASGAALRAPCMDAVLALVGSAAAGWRWDPGRVALTGISMGGGAAWDLARAVPCWTCQFGSSMRRTTPQCQWLPATRWLRRCGRNPAGGPRCSTLGIPPAGWVATAMAASHSFGVRDALSLSLGCCGSWRKGSCPRPEPHATGADLPGSQSSEKAPQKLQRIFEVLGLENELDETLSHRDDTWSYRRQTLIHIDQNCIRAGRDLDLNRQADCFLNDLG